jgi:WD40 repeat protein/energy-coupling factor transporter ATP-binding protein EcfA2
MSSRLPYPGLRPFRRDETDIFFGREKQTDQLLEKLDHSRFIAVVGPSGCGKSSLVKAGMIAALEAGFMVSAGATWRVAEMRPGDHPLQNLSNALLEDSALGPERIQSADASSILQAVLRRGPLGLVEVLRETRLPPHTNLLLLVDQFEEIFRYRKRYMADEADAFVSMMLASCKDREFPIYVVITMRSDFLGDCARFYGLPEAMNDNQFLTPRLTREQCKAAIEGPAEVYGGHVEATLVNRLLNDMGPDPDQLPLMQHVLMRMWTRALSSIEEAGINSQDLASEVVELEHASKIKLILAGYEEVGGLAEALSKHADEAYAELNDKQRRICETMFRCLSERSLDQPGTRRPVQIMEIAQVSGTFTEAVMDVIEVFRRPDRSFITPPANISLKPERILDISHESLIRQWKRMNAWVSKEFESANVYQNLEQTALRWEDGKAALWGAPDLDHALNWRMSERPTKAWAKRYGTDFKLAMKFLDASEDERKKNQKKEEKRQQRELEQAQALAVEKEKAKRLRILFVMLVCYTLFALGVAMFAFNQRQMAQKNAENAEKARGEAEKARGDAVTALQKVEAAREEVEHLYNISNTQMLAFRAPREQMFGRQDERAALLARQAYIFNDRFKGNLHNQIDDALRTILSADHFCLILQGHQAPVKSVAFSPDGYTLATAGDDQTVILWDLKNPTNEPRKLEGQQNMVRFVVFSPDGNTLASAGDDQTVILWDLKTAKPKLQVLQGHEDRVNSVAFSPDGSILASASDDETVRLWPLHNSTAGHITLRGHKGWVYSVNFSPDGFKLASASKDETIRLWSLNDLAAESQVLAEQLVGVYDVAFSPDGKTIAATSEDKLLFWDLENPGKETDRIKGTEGKIYSIAFSPDGKFLASANDGKTVRLDHLKDSDKDPIFLRGFEKPVNSVTFSLDGNSLAAASADKTVRLWDMTKPVAKPYFIKGSRGVVVSVAFNPNNGVLASSSSDQKVLLWDLKNLSRKPEELGGHRGGVNSVAFSPDGNTLASAGDDQKVILWNLKGQTTISDTLEGHQDPVNSVAFSPYGNALASAGNDSRVLLWDLTSLTTRPKKFEGHIDWVNAVAFSSGGSTLASASDDGTVRLWDLKNPANEPFILKGHIGPVYSVAFSPDGNKLASGGEDQTVRLWDYKNSGTKPIILRTHKATVYSVIFSPDGDTLASAGADQTVCLWGLKNLTADPVVLKGQRGLIESLAFSPDGRILASASYDRTILLNLAQTKVLADIVCNKVRRNLSKWEWKEFVSKKMPYENTCPNLPHP